MNLHLVGIHGLAFSGKSTLATKLSIVLENKGYEVLRLPFAQPLKKIAHEMGWNGKKDEKGRRLLQLLGTECMRECIDPDGWITLWMRHVKRQYRMLSEVPIGGLKGLVVIADDMRFLNEAACFEQGVRIKVSAIREIRAARAKALGEALPADGVHASERELVDVLFSSAIDTYDGISDPVVVELADKILATPVKNPEGLLCS